MNINTRNLSFVNFNGQKMQWVKFNGVTVYEAWKNLIASGVPPLTLTKCKGVDLIDYKLYGNSVQDVTPTPEAPIEVESVGDKTKNLINKEKAEEGYFINSSGSKISTQSYGLKVTEKIYVKTSTNYVYSGMGNVNGTTVMRCGYQYDVNDTPIKLISASNGENVKFTTEANCSYVLLQYVKTEECPMLEENTVATDYEPYGYKIPVKASGKNLFDYDNVVFKPQSVNTVEITKENNSFIFTNDKNAVYYCNTPNISYFNLKPNTTYTSKATVTLIDNGSTNINAGGSMSMSLKLQTNVAFDSNGIYIVNGYKVTGGGKTGTFEVITTFTTPEDMTDFKYVATRVVSYCEVIFKDIIITEGESVGDYEPYYEPITTNIYLDEPLRKVGDYTDYIDFENKKVVRNIGYAQMLSSYPYVKSGSASNDTMIAVVYGSSPFGKAKTYASQGYCNIGKVCYNNSVRDTGYVYWAYNANISTFFGVPTSILTELGFTSDVQGLKDFIDYQNAINPIMIQFILATPTEETIELPNIQTLKGTTILEVDTTIQPSNLEVVYKGK